MVHGMLHLVSYDRIEEEDMNIISQRGGYAGIHKSCKDLNMVYGRQYSIRLQSEKDVHMPYDLNRGIYPS